MKNGHEQRIDNDRLGRQEYHHDMEDHQYDNQDWRYAMHEEFKNELQQCEAHREQ